MDTSYFLARLIGPLLVVVGLGLLLNAASYRSMAEEFLRSRALIYIAGLLAFVPGLAIVLTHNVWVADWRVLVTLLGWLALIGGIFRLLFPQEVTRLGSTLINREGYMTGAAIFMLALGAWLSFVGYFH